MSKNTKYSFAKVALFAAVLAVASPMITNANASTAAEDTSLYQAVREAVRPYEVFFDSVNASVRDGVVTLTGHVESWNKSQSIEKHVASLSGVTKVRNSLHVNNK